MKFEVYNSENKIMEWTEDFECIKDSYQKGHLAEMRKQKWKFKLDGKLISYPQIEDMILRNICKKDYKPAPKKKVRKSPPKAEISGNYGTSQEQIVLLILFCSFQIWTALDKYKLQL